MPINEAQAKLYLALEGHLPETFLLKNVFGLTTQQAAQVAKELERLVVENNPAVRSLHIAGRRKQLRKKYGLPEVENEEIAIMNGMTVAHQAVGMPAGIRVTGSIGDLLNSIFGGGQAQSHIHTEQDQPSNLGVQDFLRGFGFQGPPPEESEEDDAEDN